MGAPSQAQTKKKKKGPFEGERKNCYVLGFEAL